jgi:inhibitor of cysteine peptidase
MLLTANDRERRVEVSAGTVVTVRLPEEATTGYRWTIEAGEGLEQAGDRVEPPGAIGGGSTRELQFRATRPGTRDLRMKKWREWEGDGSVIDRFAVTIIVK